MSIDLVSGKDFSNALTPLKWPKHPESYGVFDIEGREWTKHLLTGSYDGSVYREFRDHKGFLDYAFDSDIKCWFAHFGGIYDFLFTLDKVFTSRGRYTLIDLIPRGSGILCFSIANRKGVKLTFRDSSALFPFGLRKLADSFGVATKKQSMDVTRLRAVTARLIEYNRTDCLALYECIDAFHRSDLIRACGAKTTLASQAIQYLRTTLPDKIPGIGDGHDAYLRRAYAGGRVEIFRPLFRGPGSLRCFDFNSLYPAVMRGAVPPTQVLGYSRDWDGSTGYIDCDVEVPEARYPVLWVRDWRDARGDSQSKMVFPTGKLRGRWPSVELEYALAQGAKITKIRSFVKMGTQGEIFREFVDRLYEMRQSASDPVQNIIAKLLMNSCYGRMGMKREKEKFEIDVGQDGIPLPFLKIGDKELRLIRVATKTKGFSNVAIAAWITALARIRLHTALLNSGPSAYYCDTDSIFTPESLETGDGLGQLKLEYEVPHACFLLPKTYAAGSLIKAKGIPKDKLSALAYEDFVHALDGDKKALRVDLDQRMLRLRSAMQKGKILQLSKKGAEKRIKASYDKRVLYRDGDGQWNSRPLHFAGMNSVTADGSSGTNA